MGKIRRTFDAQFKTRVCQAIQSGAGTISEVCREYQLSRTVVDRWLAAYSGGTLDGRQSAREKELERENEKLRAKVGELTMQVDVLKKVAAWKQRQKSVASSVITASNLEQFQKPVVQSESQSRPTTTVGKAVRR